MDIIPAKDITIGAVTQFLKNSGVGHWLEDASTVFIQGNMDIWIQLDRTSRDLIISSYHDFADDVDDVDKLTFANELNLKLKLIQFSYDPTSNRLNGNYVISFKDGLAKWFVMRSAIRFSRIFHVAVPKEDREGLLDSTGETVMLN